MKAEILADRQLHAVDLSEKTRHRRPVIDRIGFGPAQVGRLLVEPGDPVQDRLQLLIVGDHVRFHW